MSLLWLRVLWRYPPLKVASSGHRDLDFPGTPYISFGLDLNLMRLPRSRGRESPRGLGQLLAERAVLTVHLATSVAGASCEKWSS